MPLSRRDYDPARGELFTHSNANPYTNRIRSQYLFRSKNNESVLATSNVTFTNAVNIGGSSETMSDSWPLQLSDGTVPTELSFNEKIYNITFITTTNVLQIEIIGPFLESLYSSLFPGDDAAAAAALARDTEIFNAYREDLKKILNASNSDGLVENFFGFNWGTIDTSTTQVDCTDVVSEVEEVVSITETCNDCPTLPSGFSRSRLSVSLRLQNNENFPGEIFSGSNFWSTDSTRGNIEYNPSLLDSTLAGDIVQLNGNFGIVPNQYIEIGDLGRYFVTDVVNDIFLFVKRVDGSAFEVGTHASQSIRNINLQPRLKIKYRIPTTGGGGDPTPAATYQFYSLPEGDGYKKLATNSSAFARDHIQSSEHQVLIDSGGIFTVGAGRAVNGVNISTNGLPWGVNTTKDDQTTEGGNVSVRVTPWRKGYRAANRFVPKEATIRRKKVSTGTNAFIRQNMTLGIAASSQTGDDIKYPEAILHAPTLTQLESGQGGGGGKGDIIFNTERIGNVQLLSGGFANEDLDSASDFMVSGFEHTIEETDDSGNPLNGYILEETAPNRITFTANMAHTGNERGLIPAFDYTGHVSTKDGHGVIPAYSGEIVAADNDTTTQMNPEHGFIEFNYTNPDIGLFNQFAVFIDISETDEVLRWNTNNYDAAAVWRDTFSALQVRNVTKGKVVNLQNYTVKKNSKTNYVVVMHMNMDALDPSFVIETDDEIRIEFRSKQVIENYTAAENPSDTNTSYVPISYRPLEDEGQDDIFVEAVEARLSDFTISSDGTIDGNITINYDGDVPEGTEFRIFIQDDEDTTP